ncbi:MAG TPA: hypothetical protein VMC48_01250 [Methanobacterium sp.]|nr:hypothetical protein [Methanobacterium sp.]
MMKEPSALEKVVDLMQEFASITGLIPHLKLSNRYLWTDAFAVCNYLELYRQTRDESFHDLALKLVDQVHHILGRYREDDSREGWISGLSQEEGELHPTKGGLRIGKKLNERLPGEPFNESLEWDRDGQYYHYLTKWMHALLRVSETTKDPVYIGWSLELAQAAHAAFTYNTPGGFGRMYWKMSVDLKHPLVTSMGQHDPLDGYITYLKLQNACKRFKQSSDMPDLSVQIKDMSQICRGMNWLTDDPLGIGGLLSDTVRIAQLKIKYGASMENGMDKLLVNMLESALLGLDHYSQGQTQKLPAPYRLAFREMGLSIGIKGMEYFYDLLNLNESQFKDHEILRDLAEDLLNYVPLAESLENFWLKNENRSSTSWNEHREINMVMLATSLAPRGFLGI